MTEPDKAEKGVRFGCGFLLGLVLGAFASARYFFGSGSSIAVATILIAVILGIAAMRFGDRFWYSLKHWAWWIH